MLFSSKMLCCTIELTEKWESLELFWLFSGEFASKYNGFFKLSDASREVFDASIEMTGDIVVGRLTYDAVEGWGGSHPVRGVPVFVVTHDIPEKAPEGTTPFTFVTDGVESAIEQAKAAAGGKHIGVAGARIVQQCLQAGLLDEIHLHLVPVLLGNGIRLFEHFGSGPVSFGKNQTGRGPWCNPFNLPSCKVKSLLPCSPEIQGTSGGTCHSVVLSCFLGRLVFFFRSSSDWRTRI